MLYTPPGHLAAVGAEMADEVVLAWRQDAFPEEETVRQVAAWLRNKAEEAQEQWQHWRQTPFSPECLTIYLSNQCRLACSYCYVAPERQSPRQASPIVQEDAALAAARLVAQHCAEYNKPFHLVLHGGGEPTLHWELVERLEAATRRMAHQFGLEWRGHLATNGILSEQQAQWAARHFSTVGLSCDGPPDIQNCQRPFQGGNATSGILERSARIFNQEGGNYTIRATITPQTVERQVDIVAYFYDVLHATDIRFEPVYHVRGSGHDGFQPADAARFVEHFLNAQQEARSREITLRFSGARLEEVHGPYCDALRQVLHLNPDGTASACFFSVDGRTDIGNRYKIGSFDAKKAEFILNHERIASHRQHASAIPEFCQNCINIYHCSRGCPEFCHVDRANSQASFRCQVQQQLAQAWILEAAQKIVRAETSQPIADSFSAYSRHHPIAPYLKELPSDINADAIISQWEAVHNVYSIADRTMPSPVWAERDFDDNGLEAWQRLQREIPSNDATGAMAMYIHVPFCDRRCGFCDCYSLPLGEHQREKNEDQYTQALFAEMAAWAQIVPLAQRPVSTIHFGGGTPNCLHPDRFAQIVDRCRQYFHIIPETEWALESTSSLLTEQHLRHLQSLGFTRLHIGVQTLEEPLRYRLGRRETGHAILQKISQSLKLGFITSVDIIYGLPGQTAKSLINTLKLLIDVGIHGVSLYRLNRSRRNQNFLKKFRDFPNDVLHDYVLFQIANQMLGQAGYRKNHFTHFALPEDRNLYYTHAKRGEDLLALGPTADGVFGDYHYRHSEYQLYVSGLYSEIPVLEGGLAETPTELSLRPVITALMTGSVTQLMIEEFPLEFLLERWTEAALLTKFHHTYMLTANGSWFISTMISELKRQVEK